MTFIQLHDPIVNVYRLLVILFRSFKWVYRIFWLLTNWFNNSSTIKIVLVIKKQFFRSTDVRHGFLGLYLFSTSDWVALPPIISYYFWYLNRLPFQHDSEEMLPIPSSFQLSPRQQPRRHSFEPSILLPHMGSSAKSVTLQQHLEVRLVCVYFFLILNAIHNQESECFWFFVKNYWYMPSASRIWNCLLTL